MTYSIQFGSKQIENKKEPETNDSNETKSENVITFTTSLPKWADNDFDVKMTPEELAQELTVNLPDEDDN